jgi:anti-sigma factor RsiW
MKCDVAARQLSDYLDGHLSPAARERLEMHLAGCSGCRRDREALQATLRLVSQLGRLKCPVDCRESVLSQLPIAPIRPANRLWLLAGDLRRRLGAMAAAGALAAACAGGLVLWAERVVAPPGHPVIAGLGPGGAAVVDPAAWHDVNRTQQALGMNDSLILSVPDRLPR